MPIFAAAYVYHHDEDHVATRDEVRPAHRAWLLEQDALRMSGPTDDDNALLVFEADSAAEVEAHLDGDPFAGGGRHRAPQRRRVEAGQRQLAGPPRPRLRRRPGSC